MTDGSGDIPEHWPIRGWPTTTPPWVSSLNADGELALDVARGERGECVGRFREVVCRLHRQAQCAVSQEAAEPLQVFACRCGHDHRPPGTFTGRSGGRGDAATVLDEAGGNVGCVVHEVKDSVEPVGVALARRRGEVAVTGQQLADAELAKVSLVLGQRGGDDGGAGPGGE